MRDVGGGSAGHGDGGVVDEQVDGPERGTGLVDEPVDVVVAREVGADGDGASTVGLDGGDGVVDGAGEAFVEDLLGTRRDRDRGAFARERARDRLADPATGSGDDRHPIGEPRLAHITVRYCEPSASAGSAKKRIMLVCAYDATKRPSWVNTSA